MNTHTEHTPGPWSVVSVPTSGPAAIREIESESGLRLALVGIHGTTKTPDVSECVANARLIAAAPDLLKALETIAKTNGGRWLDPDGNECQETDEGARWEEYTPEEQIRWLESCAQLAAEAIARAKNA